MKNATTGRQRLVMALLSVVAAMAMGEEMNVKRDIDWAAFLGRHDLSWTEMPKRWLDAPYLGNGMMGTMVLQTGDRAVRWQVGRGDVQAHRPLSYGDQKCGTMYARNRLPIGYFELVPVGKVTGGSIKLDLWNAEASGEITTDRGSIRWRSLVHADRMLILTELDPTEGERECRWVWYAEPAVSPRLVYRGESKDADWYKPNQAPVESEQAGIRLCTQPLIEGGETVTAWAENNRDGKRLLAVSVAHSYPERTVAKEAVAEVKAIADISTEELVRSHRDWWHDYYPQSFITLPDAGWEGFYWVQMYKLASATREDGMLIDNQGPWLQRTPWPGIWWNLNVQLTYWPTYTSNRLKLGASLGKHIFANAQNLIDTVPVKYRHDSAAVDGATGQDLLGAVEPPTGENAPQMGLLLWGLHNCWLHYRHSMDDQILRNDLFPMLKRAVNYYFHFMTGDEKGTLHIPQTWSPEYKAGKGPDTNFDLALLRWGCTALIESCERLAIDDPLLPKWRKVLEHLTPYPVNANGYMIAAQVPFSVRHRHYSHLLMLYPLYLVNYDQEGTAELAMKSLKHWQSFGVRHGYAVTGASSIASAFGHGNEALEYLQRLREFISCTTMYSEAGGAPVIETPLSGAQSIHDMVLQSWGNTIRVFPAAPDAWGDIAFDDFRAQGAFLVSAVREKGQTKWVRVKSLAGEPCRIRPGLRGRVRVTGARSHTLTELDDGSFSLDLRTGEEVLLFTGDSIPETVVKPMRAVAEQIR